MKESQTNEILKQMLEHIQKAVELYNSINQEEQIKLAKLEQKDVSSTFVCVYNDNCVGLFKKINWSSPIHQPYNYLIPEYDAGSIYVGIDSNYIGIKETHNGTISTPSWKKVGTKINMNDKSYVANCNMQNGMSFDDMRLIMYNKGQIKQYEIGKATSKEMLEVLAYASSYYQLNSDIKRQKSK